MKGRRPSRFLFCQQVSTCIAQFSAVPMPSASAGPAICCCWCLCCCWPLLAALQRLSSGRESRLTLWLPWRLCRAGWRLVKAPLAHIWDIWDRAIFSQKRYQLDIAGPNDLDTKKKQVCVIRLVSGPSFGKLNRKASGT